MQIESYGEIWSDTQERDTDTITSTTATLNSFPFRKILFTFFFLLIVFDYNIFTSGVITKTYPRKTSKGKMIAHLFVRVTISTLGNARNVRASRKMKC